MCSQVTGPSPRARVARGAVCTQVTCELCPAPHGHSHGHSHGPWGVWHVGAQTGIPLHTAECARLCRGLRMAPRRSFTGVGEQS